MSRQRAKELDFASSLVRVAILHAGLNPAFCDSCTLEWGKEIKATPTPIDAWIL